MSQTTHVVVGGGLNGLMLTDLLSRQCPTDSIVLLEAAPQCGGLLRSFDYAEHGLFDYGTHILSETGKPGLDRYLHELLPDGEWNYLRGSRRNIAGLYFAGQIQSHTLYPDLTIFDDQQYGNLLRCFFENGFTEDGDSATNAYDYMVQRYGKAIAETVGRPIVEKFARCPAEKLDKMVISLCPLDRLAMFPAAAMPAVVAAQGLGERVAYVDQRDLPASEVSGLASFYPRKRGMQQMIDALLNRLAANPEVSVRCSQSVTKIERADNTLRLQLGDGSELQAAQLYWTANLLTAAKPLGIDVDYLAMDKPLTNALCHFVFPEPTHMGDLYYLFCADANYQAYRYTNYSAYCAEDAHTQTFPVTVELLLDDVQLQACKQDITSMALSEMVQMGLVDASSQPRFSKLEVLSYGFARPTLANQAELSRVRQEIRARGIDNLAMLGIGSKKNLFFMSEILQNTFGFIEQMKQPLDQLASIAYSEAS